MPISAYNSLLRLYTDTVLDAADLNAARADILLDAAGAVSAMGFPFYAKGDGVTDDSAALQAWINYLKSTKGSGFLPPTATGYRVNHAIDLTNTNNVRIYGGGSNGAASFGLAQVTPTAGSLLIANTGTGKPVIDMTGSCNIAIEGIAIDATNAPTPSQYGIIAGTSTGTQIGSPGGSNCNFTDVSVILPGANTVPLYFNNLNSSTLIKTTTVGTYGLVFSGSNPLGITPPYATFGPAIQSDCNWVGAGSCFLSTNGNAAPLVLEQCNESVFDQIYLNAFTGDVSTYAGQAFAMTITNCTGLRIKVQSDYFPSLFAMYGANDDVRISGSQFPGGTPIPQTAPLIGLLAGTSVRNSAFDVRPYAAVLGTPGNQYLYTSIGGAGTMTDIANTRFRFDPSVLNNTAYLNLASGGPALPFNNLIFEGASELTGGMTFSIAGTAAASSKLRYSINGKSYGTG